MRLPKYAAALSANYSVIPAHKLVTKEKLVISFGATQNYTDIDGTRIAKGEQYIYNRLTSEKISLMNGMKYLGVALFQLLLDYHREHNGGLRTDFNYSEMINNYVSEKRLEKEMNDSRFVELVNFCRKNNLPCEDSLTQRTIKIPLDNRKVVITGAGKRSIKVMFNKETFVFNDVDEVKTHIMKIIVEKYGTQVYSTKKKTAYSYNDCLFIVEGDELEFRHWNTIVS